MQPAVSVYSLKLKLEGKQILETPSYFGVLIAF